MAVRADITPELCRQFLSYDPDTGKLSWKPRPLDLFEGSQKPELSCAGWNKRHAGKAAFTAPTGSGHLSGRIRNIGFLAHRVAFAMHHGRWPVLVDHINGDPTDNRIANLREATPQENQRNAKLSKNNSSGANGVYFNRQTGKWYCQIWIDGRAITQHGFATKEEATAERQRLNGLHGFTARHGEA